MLAAHIEAYRLYVTDRSYAKFELFNQIVVAGSSYVCRLRDNSAWSVVEEKYRNDDAALNEIISDEMVQFSKGSGLTHKVRAICIRMNPHTTRGKYRGGSSGVDSDGILRIVTVSVPNFRVNRIIVLTRGNRYERYERDWQTDSQGLIPKKTDFGKPQSCQNLAIRQAKVN